MLQIKNLKKTFEGGTEALRGVDLKVNKGEIILKMQIVAKFAKFF